MAVSNTSDMNSRIVERAFRSILTTAKIVVEEKIRDEINPPPYWDRLVNTLQIVLTHQGPDLIATASNAMLMMFERYARQEPRNEEAAFHLMYITSISEAISDKVCMIEIPPKVQADEKPQYLH